MLQIDLNARIFSFAKVPNAALDNSCLLLTGGFIAPLVAKVGHVQCADYTNLLINS